MQHADFVKMERHGVDEEDNEVDEDAAYYEQSSYRKQRITKFKYFWIRKTADAKKTIRRQLCLKSKRWMTGIMQWKNYPVPSPKFG